MDNCPRCDRGDRTRRATEIVNDGELRLRTLLRRPVVSRPPNAIVAHRVLLSSVLVWPALAASARGASTPEQAERFATYADVAAPILLVLAVAGLVLRIRNAAAVRSWQARRTVHRTMTQLWSLLNHCERCDVVFLTGSTDAAAPDRTTGFLHGAALDVLRSHGVRLPGT